MIKVYGYSDDNLVLDGAPYPADEIGCFEQDVIVEFDDGTRIRAGYPKKDIGVWYVKVEKKGTAPQKLIECFDEDAELYSDLFEIDANYVEHRKVASTRGAIEIKLKNMEGEIKMEQEIKIEARLSETNEIYVDILGKRFVYEMDGTYVGWYDPVTGPKVD